MIIHSYVRRNLAEKEIIQPSYFNPESLIEVFLLAGRSFYWGTSPIYYILSFVLFRLVAIENQQ